jgi:hypothetical protein
MAKDIAQPSDEQIRVRAYYLWEADGRPHGRDWEYWVKAKEELTPKAASQVRVAATPNTSVKSNKSESAPTQKRAGKRTAVYA